MAALELAQAAGHDVATALSALDTSRIGLTSSEALDRLHSHGPNAVRSHRARAIDVLLRQLKSLLLILLVGDADGPHGGADRRRAQAGDAGTAVPEIYRQSRLPSRPALEARSHLAAEPTSS